MSAPSAGTNNLVEDFEEAFQNCLNVLTKQDAGPCVEKEEVKVEVEKFIDVARQMEAFFLQKWFLLSALKPDLLVKEENNELRLELARKEELIKRHYDKISVWQNVLADLQGYAKSGGQSSGAGAVTGTAPGIVPGVAPGMTPGMGPGVAPGMAMQTASPIPQAGTPQPMQQMQHAPHAQMQVQQQMQQHMAGAAQAQQLQQMQQQQHAAAMQMGGVPQGMFMQQGGPRGPYPQPGSLQGPLAYLEKTTTNIDLVGMGDGRR